MGEGGGVPVVGGFSDLVEVGRGGFSRVFSAYQVEFDRRVALKVLNDRLADDASVAVFESECRAMGTLSQHPFIVTVLASALTADYRPCIVMELFERGNYMQLLRRDGPLPLEELLSLAVRVAGALATAHHHGVVHGDVKPQNVLKSEFGYPALGDFGIATLRNRLSERAGTSLSAHYAAPELIESGATAAGAAADQYSLAATIFTLACGRRPFEGAAAGEAPERVLARVLAAPTPRLAASFPQDLAGTLARAMSRDPHHRFPDLAALAFALTAVEHQLGYRATAVPLASIDDDATITINHPSPPQQPPPPSPPPSQPPAPPTQPPGDEHTIAIAPQPPEPPAPPQQPNRRRRIAALAVFLAATAGAATYLTLQTGTPEPDTATQATSPQPGTELSSSEPDNQPALTDTTTQATSPQPGTELSSSEPDDEPVPADAATQATSPQPGTELSSSEPDDQPVPADAAEGSSFMTPGAGVSVTMARANWDTGYFQAQVFKHLLEELGYEVNDPSQQEMGPSLAYLAIAQGDVEFWANSWYPLHSPWLQPELPDGSLVGDNLEIVGELTTGLEGYLITKSVADRYGITHLDQINDDPRLTALFDTDSDGKAEIYGCPEAWRCDNIIDNQIAFSGWDNIEQITAGYDAMFAEAVTRVAAGEPAVVYTWAPSRYIAQLRPGDNVVWLAVEEVLDNSNPTGVEGGERHAQLPGRADIPPEQCPAAAEAGTCQLGWVTADIRVTANKDFLRANPAARALLEQVKLPPVDVSRTLAEQDSGRDPDRLAAEWIAANRSTVDQWLTAARAAS